MKQLFPQTAAVEAPVDVKTMKDVKDWILAQTDADGNNKCKYLLQYIRTLQTHCNGTDLSNIPADMSWIEEEFPKASRGKHPLSATWQNLDAYKKWRRCIILAIKKATGIEAESSKRKERKDSWADLLIAAKSLRVSGKIKNPAELGPLSSLAEIARRADLATWQLGDPNAVARLEENFQTPLDLEKVRRSFKVINKHGTAAELRDFLPALPLSIPELRRNNWSLPEHIDTQIAEWVRIAARGKFGYDAILADDNDLLSVDTINCYFASLRHHLRALSVLPEYRDHFGVDPNSPSTALRDGNCIKHLFGAPQIASTIRTTAEKSGKKGGLKPRTAFRYYQDILTVLSRNDIDVSEIANVIKTNKFLRDASLKSDCMTEKSENWCRLLVNDPERRRRFQNLHRILQAKAAEILNTAELEGRSLTKNELTRVRQWGTAAAASAIEWSGRPIRLSNVLKLRLSGNKANFFVPSPKLGIKEYTFRLAASETKARKAEPPIPLRKELYGPQVIEWYLNHIRPLFPHARTSDYLFPAVLSANRPLPPETFDTWFQCAASRAKLPMTFHQWRHGYATLLLQANWNNLSLAARMLGNTPKVCAANYAWIDQEKMFEEGQNILIAESRRK